MKAILALSSCLVASCLLILPARGQVARGQTGDPSIGLRIAEANCATCHQIKPGVGPQLRESKAPSFEDISRMPSTTELSIKVFLRSSHRNMPNLILTPEEIDSVAAYILSLSGK
jgi:mono/diheme cytochrome c family protein